MSLDYEEELDEFDEDELEDEEDEEEEICIDDYCGYPFAVEVVNWDVISLTADMQKQILARLLEHTGVTEEELIAYLTAYEEGEEPEDDRLEVLHYMDFDAIADALGFDSSGQCFSPKGIDAYGSSYGDQIKDLLKDLGFSLDSEINEGPHGHGTYGVYFIE